MSGARLLEGFSSRLSEYRTVRPQPERLVLKAARPVPGTDLERDKIVTFNFSSFLNELIRFKEEPLVIKGKLKWVIPTEAGTSEQVFNPRNVSAEVTDRHCRFLHPALQGASFVSAMDVQLDKQFVDNSSLGPYQSFYTALEKTFVTRDDFLEKYGREMVRFSRTDQAAMPTYSESGKRDRARLAAGVVGLAAATAEQQAVIDRIMEVEEYLHLEQPLLVPPKMLELTQNLVTYNTDDHTVSFKVGFAGLFPFACQSNILRGITGEKRSNPFLHPGINVCVNVHLRDPIGAAMERYGLSASEFHDHESAAVLAPPAGEVKFEIEEMSLEYESLTLREGYELGALRSNVHNYLSDSALVQQRFLNNSTALDRQSFPLTSGTLAVALMFTHQDFLLGLRGRNITPRSTFISGLKAVSFTLSGDFGQHEILRLVDPGLKKGFRSQSLRNYHADLIAKKLYDAPFSDWYPPEQDVFGLEQAVVLDLIPYNIKENSELIINLEYQDASATSRHALLCFSLLERGLRYTSGSAEWNTAPIAASA